MHRHCLQVFELEIRRDHGHLVRLGDVAKVELGSESYDSSVILNGKKAVFVGISTTPTANPLTVIKNIREQLPILQKSFPPSLHAHIVYDATRYISSSLHEVISTIAEATVIVILVIFLFLGSLRNVLIPVMLYLYL